MLVPCVPCFFLCFKRADGFLRVCFMLWVSCVDIIDVCLLFMLVQGHSAMSAVAAVRENYPQRSQPYVTGKSAVTVNVPYPRGLKTPPHIGLVCESSGMA